MVAVVIPRCARQRHERGGEIDLSEPPVISHQPSAISHPSSIINHQSSVINHQPSATSNSYVAPHSRTLQQADAHNPAIRRMKSSNQAIEQSGPHREGVGPLELARPVAVVERLRRVVGRAESTQRAAT
eukprot:3830302-Prymnesium_polylepis.1